MAADQNTLDQVTDRIDAFVKPFCKSDVISKIETCSIYTSLIAMGWHKKVTEALRTHFETLTKIGGILSIVFGCIGVFAALAGISMISAFGPGYAVYLGVVLLTSVFLCVLGVVSGFGLLAKKEWIPFLAVVQFGVNIVSQLVFKIAEAAIPKTTTLSVFGVSFSTVTETSPITASWIFSFCISIALGFIGLSFVMRLKDMFGKK